LQLGKSDDDALALDSETDAATKSDDKAKHNHPVEDDAGDDSGASLGNSAPADTIAAPAKQTQSLARDDDEDDDTPRMPPKRKAKHAHHDDGAGDDSGAALSNSAPPDAVAAPAKTARQLTEGEKAAQAFGYDLSDDDDESVAPPPPAQAHKAKHKRKAHKKHHVVLDADSDDQTPPATQPMAHTDDDLAADDASAPAQKRAASANFDLGGSDDTTSASAGSGADAAPAKLMAKDFDGGNESPPPAVPIASPAGGRLPGQYAAWTPSDAATAAKQKQAMLAQMESDFDSDDDTPPTPAPKRHHGHKKHAAAPVVAKQVDKDDDGVVYDDDDLPKHHHASIKAELEGGWKSLMKKSSAAKSKKPKLDPDIAIMQSLYSDDGALPSQYTAWSPNQPAPSHAVPAQPAKATQQDDAQDDDDNDDGGDAASFFQVLSVPDFSAILEEVGADHGAEAVSGLIGDAAHGSNFGSSSWFGASAFLERSEFHVDTSRVSAAHGLLQQYADVLKSTALRQLAQAKPSPPKLAALSKRLSAVDPLVHPGASTSLKREQQAEQWCLYFEKHQQSVAPMQKALAQLEEANVQFSNISSQRAAVAEEVDARTQLEKAVEQDLQGLSSMLALLQRAEDGPSFSAQEAQSASAAPEPPAKALLNLGEAVASWRSSHMELVDIIRAALRSRSITLGAQRARLLALQQEAAEKERAVSKEQAEVTSAQNKVSAIRSKLTKIGATCEATLTNLERRRHAGHMEAHAVDMAVKVLGAVPQHA